MTDKKIAFITSKQLRNECNKIPIIRMRASLVDELISAYGLLNKFKIIEPRTATTEDIRLFHSSLYISYLKKQDLDNSNSESDEVDDEQLEYGLGYDCPKLDNLWSFSVNIVGATLSAVEEILNGTKVAINWCGGWHHAQRDEAEGFCYVNDIAIGIQKLREKFKRVFYIDLDAHHGNGVENAFAYTKRVFTLSFHQYEAGFFPGTGSINDCGHGQGKGYCANFPYKSQLSGNLFCEYFQKVTTCILEAYKPDVCVVQCGADAIVGDPLGNTNLTPIDLGKCVKDILHWNLPTIFLGGGGYNIANTSKYWTYLTSIICNETLEEDIPDNKYFLRYGPGYELNISSKIVKDQNCATDFEQNYNKIKENLKKYNVGPF